MKKKVGLALLALLLLIQVIPVDRQNPPPTTPLQTDADVTAIFERACYDCHSHNTIWPWYGYVAPVSWWLADHIRHGRSELNFSTWGDYTSGRMKRKLDEIREEVEKDAMPLPSYRLAHRDAILTAEEKQRIYDWVNSERQKLDAAFTAPDQEKQSTQ